MRFFVYFFMLCHISPIRFPICSTVQVTFFAIWRGLFEPVLLIKSPTVLATEIAARIPVAVIVFLFIKILSKQSFKESRQVSGVFSRKNFLYF